MKLYRHLVLAFLSLAILFSAYRDAAAKDQWVQVKSKNFYLIGNASEKDIRRVATRLEQFRETFRLLFSQMNFASPVPTNVVVFKSDSYYKNFKPKRADGKIDNFIAGYFQSGEDVNYITLAADGEDAQTFSTIFHEYVHNLVNTNFGKSEVPAWFNEGLAEYYETFAIKDGQRVKLGLLQQRHIPLLQQNKLMPLATLFNISNSQLLETGDHSRSIFYAESWALIHHLIMTGKSEGLGRFLAALLRGVPPEKAFQDVFQTTYAAMENDLRKYVGKNTYQYQEITLKNKLAFDADMRASPLDESEAGAYLGDLLYHTNRVDDAEPYLVAALKLQPDSSMANTTLGMVKLKQRKFDEAKTYLEKAIAGDHKNHIAYYRYAFLLSREGRDEFGFVQKFDPATAAKMREALRRAIAINPAFTESYELLAFVDLVNNEEFDDAVTQLQTALKYQPGNQRYAIRIAEILARQHKFDEAAQIAEKIGRTADDPEIKNRAQSLTAQIAQQKEFTERNETERKRYEAAMASTGGRPRLQKRIEGVKRPTDAEIARQQEDEKLRTINDVLRTVGPGEQRVLGHIEKIDCKKAPVAYTIKTAAETFTVTSKDFDALALSSLDPPATNTEIGCDAKLAAFNALITYKAATGGKNGHRGELVAVEFVPTNFRVMTDEEMRNATLVIYDEPEPEQNRARSPNSLPPMPTAADIEQARRDMMMQSISDALRKPVEGEKRETGFLEKIECTSKGMYFYMRTATQTIKLLGSSPALPKIIVYTPDLGGTQFVCGIKPIEFPAVFIYTAKPDAKAKTAGEIISVEFVPKSFTLEKNF